MTDYDDYRFAVDNGCKYVICNATTIKIREFSTTRKILVKHLSKYDNCEVLTLRQYRKKFVEKGGVK